MKGGQISDLCSLESDQGRNDGAWPICRVMFLKRMKRICGGEKRATDKERSKKKSCWGVVLGRHIHLEF